MVDHEKEITIFGIEDFGDQMGPTKKADQFRYGRAKFKLSEIKMEINSFLINMQEIIDVTPPPSSQFELDTIEINAEINLKGKICILGNGLETGGSGGIKFVLRKKPVKK